jgi:hypothetical protein
MVFVNDGRWQRQQILHRGRLVVGSLAVMMVAGCLGISALRHPKAPAPASPVAVDAAPKKPSLTLTNKLSSPKKARLGAATTMSRTAAIPATEKNWLTSFLGMDEKPAVATNAGAGARDGAGAASAQCGGGAAADAWGFCPGDGGEKGGGLSLVHPLFHTKFDWH